MGKTTDFVFGFIGGALAGAVAGVLFAPEKGEQMRNRITYRLYKTRNTLADMLDEIRNQEVYLDDENIAKHHNEDVKRQVEEKAQKIMSDIDDLMYQIEDENLYDND